MTNQSPKTLAKFSITPEGDGYQLHIEDETGQTLEIGASYEQMELLADTLDELLEADGAGAELGEDDDDL